MRINLSISFIAVSAMSALQVSAWGAVGHEITATIAQMYLHPSVLPQICDLVYPYYPPKEPCHLSKIATWADRIRPFAQWRWAAPYHYVGGTNGWPPSKCLFGEEGWEGKDGVNVLGGIWNTTRWLKEGRNGAGEAVKFLIHFLGDVHQPLHLNARNRGGNDDKVHFHHRMTNLHSVWDSRLISNAILDTPHNYSRPLPSEQIESALRGTIYDPYVRSIVWEGLLHNWRWELEDWISCPTEEGEWTPGSDQSQIRLSSPGNDANSRSNLTKWDDDFVCPYHWAKPTAKITCDIAYPPELDWPPNSNETHPAIELNTPKYAGRIRRERIVEKLLAQGGIRTAAILNGLFAVEPSKEGKFLFAV